MTADPAPEGYRQPEIVWGVVSIDADDRVDIDFGVFRTEVEAKKCLDFLARDGRYGELAINVLAIHERVEDWQWDR